MANWLTGIVENNHQWSDRLFSLQIKAPIDNFKAGQFVRIALEINGELVARPYSLVNSPDEQLLEVYFNIVPEGPLSPILANLKKNDEVKVSDKTHGFLVIDEIPEARNLWMLATGTGVGPFLSILKSDEAWQKFDKIILGYSVRTKQELSYFDLIQEIEKNRNKQFCFVPFITREKIDDTMNCRITDAIDSGELEKLSSVKMDGMSHIMMCGNSKMIAEVTSILEKRGLQKHRRREPGHITTEKYH